MRPIYSDQSNTEVMVFDSSRRIKMNSDPDLGRKGKSPMHATNLIRSRSCSTKTQSFQIGGKIVSTKEMSPNSARQILQPIQHRIKWFTWIVSNPYSNHFSDKKSETCKK